MNQPTITGAPPQPAQIQPGQQVAIPIGIGTVRATWLGVVSNGRELAEAMRRMAEMENAKTLKPGTQIICVPNHANGDIGHPDAEAGFVTSVRRDNAFCRYWSKHDPTTLRTKANSELTPIANLVVMNTRPQEAVDWALMKIKQGWTSG